MSEKAPLTPPVAPQHEHVDHYHGEAIEDPYHWLRERENPEVRAYLEAENAYTAEVTAPLKAFEKSLYEEMLGRIQQTDLSVPVRRGAYLYYSRTVEGMQYPIHCRKPAPDGDEQILLDQNELAKGLAFCALGDFEVSEDGRLLAYTVDETGMRRYKLAVKDLVSGALLSDMAERVTSAAWAADNQTLFYTTEDFTTKRSDRCFRRRLGTESVEIFHEPDELYHIGLGKTRDRKYIMLGIGATDATEWRYLDAAKPEGAFTVFRPRQRDHKYDLDHREGWFYVRSNLGAKNFRVFRQPVGAPAFEQTEEFVAHDAAVLIEGVDLFRSHAVIHEKAEALTRLRVHRFEDGSRRLLAFPEPVYAVHPAGNPEFETATYRYSYQSPVTPPSVYDVNLETFETELLKRQPVLGGYDPELYEAERLWATAKDGTRVPMSAVWRRDARRPQGPLLLYGYGSYGYGMSATFSSARLSLLDRGLTFVIAHIRGGDDMGEAWHDAGMLKFKPNTFGDFIACAEHLVEENWTTPERLAIEGGSAGGLLIGAVVNQRPELFRAAHLAVPFVDVINTMMDASLPLTVGEYLEWGNPNEIEYYRIMKSYCPYQNLAERRYPAMLVTTSLNDSQVMYWEPAKYVARLRALNGGAPQVLLKTNLEAGHGGASGRYDRLKEVAFEYAWILTELGAANLAGLS